MSNLFKKIGGVVFTTALVMSFSGSVFAAEMTDGTNLGEAEMFVSYEAETAAVYEDTLNSGKYAVDLTWIPMMDNMFDPIVEIDAENKTFKVYNEGSPETDKGSGSIQFDAETGVYEFTYASGVKEENIGTSTKVTYQEEENTLTFQSALLYGTAGFNNLDEDENFVPYTATAVILNAGSEEDENPGNDDSTEDNAGTDSDDNTGNNAGTDKDDSAEPSPKTADASHIGIWFATAAFGMMIVMTGKKYGKEM